MREGWSDVSKVTGETKTRTWSCESLPRVLS